MSVVHYKFKNNLDYKTISFDGLSISLGDFKQAIMSQNKTKSGEFDLEVKNAQSKEAYTDNATQIQKNASVIVRRILVGPKGKALTAAERPQSPGEAAKPNKDEVNDESPVIPLSKLNKVADLASANASEEDKIAAMMSQAGEDWDPTLYAKPKGRSFSAAPRVPPPPHYMCFRCRKPGHWIQNCPKNNDPNYDLKIRRTTGIPKSFLRLADKPTQKGALLIPDTGQYAVPIVDHNAYEQAAMKKRKDGQATIVEIEKPIPPEYFCPICKKIMNNAVVVPCCGDSFCDTCIEKYLLENEHVCPSCRTEGVSPASIVVNKHLRQAIIKVKSSGFDIGSSATSSPSAHRDGDVITQGRSTPVPMITPTSVVTTTTNVAATVGTTAPTLNTVVPSPAIEPSKAIEDGQVASTAISTSSTPQTAPVVSQDASVPAAATVLQAALPQAALPQTAIIDPRLQRPEGIVQPMAVPVPAAVTLAPVHRPAYVVSASTVGHSYHPHHALVHPPVPGIAATYGHLSHPALVPTRHTLPFAALETNVGMMNEEEFYRAKMKLQESRGRRKRRKDEDDRKSRKKERSRSRRRERRESPSSRRSPSEAVFRSVRKDRARRRGRSRSWTPTGSSSRSSWSQSWSKSPSRSYSRSKSRTPVNWDRSRSPSREKKTRSNRVEEERRKRKKQVKDLKETKQKSKTNDDDVETSEKRNVKSDKSSEQKKELKKKSKMEAEIDSCASEKVSIKTSRTKEPKKDAKKNDVDDSMSENRNIKNSKSNEAKKDVKKMKVDNDVDNSTLEKRNVKTVKSKEAKKEAKKDVEKSNVESDVDCSTAERIIVKKSKEPKKNAEKKYKLDSNINVDSTQKVNAKSVKSKDVKKGSKIKSKRDIEGSTSDKINVKTVKSLNERENVKRKMKTDEDLKEVEIETSKENTAKKRSKVDNIVSGISEKFDAKKSGITRKEIVKKCSISDLRDLVNNSNSSKTDPNSYNFEKCSKQDSNRKNSKTDYKKSERVSEISKKCAVGTKNFDVSNKMAKEIVLSAKNLNDRKERSRKKDDVVLDEGKLSRKTKEDNPAADFLVEKKSTGKSSAFKNDREELRDKQKTTRIVVEKSKDKHAREASKTSEKYGKSIPVKEERSSKDYKLISNEIKTIKDENRKKDIRKADILKKTSSSGDIEHREVSLKTKHSSSRLDYSVGKIKHNDEVSKLRVEERVRESSKKKAEKSRKYSVTDESDNWLSEEDVEEKAKRREEKPKKKRKSVSDDSDDQKRVSRKRTKDEDFQESDDEVPEKVPKKRKKKKSSLHEEERKDSKHKKKKHKKKHKKHKHKKKSKRKERKISEEAYSEETDEDDLEKDRRESRNDEITHEQGEMSADEDSTKSVESVFEGESTKAVQSESENDPEQESGSEFERSEDENIGSSESSQDGNSENDDVVEEVELQEEKERRDGVEEDDVEELDYNEESEPEMEHDCESEQEIEVDEGEHKGHEEEQSVDEVENDEEQEEVEEDSEVDEMEEGVEEDDEKEGDEGLEEEIEKEDFEQDEQQLDVDGVSEEEESLEEEHEGEEECEETEQNEYVEVEEMGQIELEHSNENYLENEIQGIGVEDEEELLADDEAHESLPGNELDDEVLLEADVAEQPIRESVSEEALVEDNAEGSMKENSNDDALLRDESTTLASGSQGNEDLFETDDVVNDVSDDVVDRVNDCIVDLQSKENVGETNLNEITQNFQSDLVEDSTNIISQELSGKTDSKDAKAVEYSGLQSNECDSKLVIEDFQTKPLAQSSDVGSRDKHHNNGTVYDYDRTQRHDSLGNYPSYDSGVGTLDCMYDDDPNYTDFGGPAENRRTSTDVFRAMINDDTEDFY